MDLKTIVISHLLKKKGRTILLVCALATPVCAIVASIIVLNAMEHDVSKKLDEFGANIVILPQSNSLSVYYGGMDVGGITLESESLKEEDVSKVRSINLKDNLYAVSPKLFGIASVNGKNLIVAGVNFEEELKMKKWWKVTGKVPHTKEQVLLGADVSRELSLRPGDEVTLNSKRLIVSGVLEETGSQDDRIVFAELSTIKKILGTKDKVSLIELAAYCHSCPIEEITREISLVIPHATVKPVKQAISGREITLSLLRKSLKIFLGILIIFGGLILFTSLLASVRERRREIGIFRAVGFRDSHIFATVILEAFFLGLLGGALGYLAGIIGGYHFSPVVVPEAQIATHNLNHGSALISISLSVALSVLSGLYPAFVATKLDPVESLKSL
ncbi:MAG: FtsX-like permease family protein [Deltaproteobacteria bacterium]|nr:FtsX-like permease family protein [Deltaproteobacteria bacterium]